MLVTLHLSDEKNNTDTYNSNFMFFFKFYDNMNRLQIGNFLLASGTEFRNIYKGFILKRMTYRLNIGIIGRCPVIQVNTLYPLSIAKNTKFIIHQFCFRKYYREVRVGMLFSRVRYSF